MIWNFHRSFKSLIAIELKIGEFKPEYTGKMQFYLTVLDEKVKLPEENFSLGIIICKSKNRTVVAVISHLSVVNRDFRKIYCCNRYTFLG